MSLLPLLPTEVWIYIMELATNELKRKKDEYKEKLNKYTNCAECNVSIPPQYNYCSNYFVGDGDFSPCDGFYCNDCLIYCDRCEENYCPTCTSKKQKCCECFENACCIWKDIERDPSLFCVNNDCDNIICYDCFEEYSDHHPDYTPFCCSDCSSKTEIIMSNKV